MLVINALIDYVNKVLDICFHFLKKERFKLIYNYLNGFYKKLNF